MCTLVRSIFQVLFQSRRSEIPRRGVGPDKFVRSRINRESHAKDAFGTQLIKERGDEGSIPGVGGANEIQDYQIRVG